MPVNKRSRRSKKSISSRKKRVRAHVIADLSANHVEKFALQNGFSVESITKDYGYDLTIYTFDSKGEFQTGNIYIQLKATDSPKFINSRREISFPTNKKDLATWFNEPFPVIFILYDAKKETAYWIYIQQHLRSLINFDIKNIPKNYSIRIPKVNKLDKSSFKQFQKYKTNTLKQINGVITYK